MLLYTGKQIPRSSRLTRREEPSWHDPNLLIKGCACFAMSNEQQVQQALSINSDVFSHLATCRNFYAHRNPETAVKVLRLGQESYSIYNVRHPSEVLAAYAYNRPQSLVLDFVDDLWAVTEILCD